MKGGEVMGILPKPCVMAVDRKGNRFNCHVAWFDKIKEELREARRAVFEGDGSLAEELGDIVTACISFMEWRGIDENERSEIFERINRKNAKRGYHDKGKDCSKTI